MKLESYHSAEEKARWKIVRVDNFTDVPGAIVTADDATGECEMSVFDPVSAIAETKTLSFGPGGCRIVIRAR